MINFAATMASAPQRSPAKGEGRLDSHAFWSLAAFADLLAIACAAVLSQVGYNALVHNWVAMGLGGVRLCGVVAVVFVLANAARRRYALSDYLDLGDHARRTANAWNLAFMAATLLGFLDRAHEDVSRGAYVAFYAIGLVLVIAARAGLANWARWAARSGQAVVARAMLVGARGDVEAPARRSEMREAGLSVERVVALSDDPVERGAQLATAVRFARRHRIGEVVVAAPVGRGDLIEACLAAFLETPIQVRLKLSPSSAKSKLAAERLAGAIAGITLRRSSHALSDPDRLVKRICDLVIGAVALVVFAPLMAAVALAIRIDSRGPVFFVQTRRGFNNRLFRIVKFSTMTTMENGRNVAQAKARDCRVTRMGRWMRRYNIDELPQLINVLRGEMSLIGPRPHAIAHDRQFARQIDFYSRRANVLPGMTGWAQVNGHRGAIDKAEHIERRVEHDLHYIDNWSLLLDFWILAMTLFSRNAYRNAF